MENPPSKKSDAPSAASTSIENNRATQQDQPFEAPQFSLSRVISAVLLVGIVAGSAYGVWTLMQKPKVLVRYTGRVLFDGKPVTVGGVATQRIDDQLDSAVGALDEEGRFSLMTNGEPGAYTGRHKMVISSQTPTMPPRLLIPAVYSSMSLTPLIIDVSEDPAENHREFVLEGSINATAQPPADVLPKEAPSTENDSGATTTPPAK